MKCARCDYAATDLSEHAHETGHLLCIVCRRRSLTEFEAQTCPVCIAAVRADLADIAAGYATLEPTGLTAMTMLGDGTMQRLFRRDEWASYGVTPHPLARDGEQVVKPIRDEWPSDPLPVVAALASWEDYWRADFGDPTGPPATLSGVVTYLTAHLDTGHRAAQRHPAFDEFAQEVRRLRTVVQHSAGLADIPVAAPAECFDCGGPLLRTFAEPRTTAEDVTRRKQLVAYIAATITDADRARRASRNPAPVHVARREAERMLFARRRGTVREGLTDDWTCAWCRRVYDQPSYFLALRAASSSWVSVRLAADTARRSVWTVWSWLRRGLVTGACRVEDRMVVVWWPDVSDRAFRQADDGESQRSA